MANHWGEVNVILMRRPEWQPITMQWLHQHPTLTMGTAVLLYREDAKLYNLEHLLRTWQAGAAEHYATKDLTRLAARPTWRLRGDINRWNKQAAHLAKLTASQLAKLTAAASPPAAKNPQTIDTMAQEEAERMRNMGPLAARQLHGQLQNMVPPSGTSAPTRTRL